ncbi:MAG: DUF3515 family protein [Leucobacter sp.]
MSRRIRTLASLTALVGAATVLTGCAGEVPMDAAVNANDPACADVIVRLPKVVADLERRATNAQSTGAWGDPAGVLLYCGIEPMGPTTQSCVNVNGVDWIVDDERAPLYRFEAYGRSPGLQVVVDSEKASGTAAVLDLSAVVKELPQTRQCTSIDDTFELGPTGGEPEV